jgi:alkylated DNA repair dioxygenase AlkB
MSVDFTEPVKTETSALRVYANAPVELLRRCAEEIDDLLDFHPAIIVYGKVCHQQRSIGFFSNESEGYKYSGQMAASKPLTPSVAELLMYINQRFGAEYNGILINKYLSGEEYIGKHSDDERALDPNTGVIACSFGAVRKFRIREKESGKMMVDVPTENDKILQMCGDFQKEFTHEIPVEKKVKDVRVSFTFRKHMS